MYTEIAILYINVATYIVSSFIVYANLYTIYKSKDMIKYIYGVKLTTIAAGLIGAIISVAYLRKITLLKSSLSIFIGFTVAVLLTPLTIHYLDIPSAQSQGIETGVAFILGLLGMNIIGIGFSISEKIRKNEISFKGWKL